MADSRIGPVADMSTSAWVAGSRIGPVADRRTPAWVADSTGQEADRSSIG